MRRLLSLRKKPAESQNSALNTGYAYSDEDILTLSQALKNRDNIEYFRTTDFTQSATAQVTTGIFNHNNQLFLEIPAISSADNSPIGPRIIEQLTHLQSLAAGTEGSEFRKQFPNGIRYPIKVIAPYKLSGSWHWNVLELEIKADKTASCKRYDTNGRSYPVEPQIFAEIERALSPQGASDEDKYCTAIENQKTSIIEYPSKRSGNAVPLQKGVNCGLASTIVMHDIITGRKSYCDAMHMLTDQQLRKRVFEIVQQYNPDRMANFGRITGTQGHKTQFELALRDSRLDRELSPITQEIIATNPNTEQLAILRQVQNAHAGHNTAGALQILRKNKEKIEDVYKILFEPGYDIIRDNSEHRLKENALDALAKVPIAIDIQPETLSAPEGGSTPAHLEARTNTLSDQLEAAISSFKNFIKDCKGDLNEEETKTLKDALLLSISPSPDQDLTDAAKQALEKEIDEVVENYNESRAAAQGLSEKPTVEEKPPAPQINEAENALLETLSGDKGVTTLKEIASRLNEEVNKKPHASEEFLKPRSYSGLGIKTDAYYNAAEKKFEFRITKVFKDGLAAKLGIVENNVITFPSATGSLEEMKEAAIAIRNSAHSEQVPHDPNQEISLLSGTPLKEKNLHAEIAQNKERLKPRILIHKKQTYAKDQFLEELRGLASSQSQPNPSMNLKEGSATKSLNTGSLAGRGGNF